MSHAADFPALQSQTPVACRLAMFVLKRDRQAQGLDAPRRPFKRKAGNDSFRQNGALFCDNLHMKVLPDPFPRRHNIEII